ncbi:UNVERIFIED_CONTAM: hypothetical protein Slati_2732900 [Sesamum latifolium]|uniref:Uncharacterized protein n=1 Tax=Sesamum latifolium TaxID=2727402 RepID=A0AAW2VYH0_9LAMI
MLRARYFVQGSFFEVTVRVQPSYAWHSLLCTRALLEVGLYWFIGSESSVPVVVDSWIPRKVSFWPVVQPRLLQHDQRVSSLSRLEGSWLEEEVQEVFAVIDAKWIVRIPVRNGGSHFLGWHFNPQGRFSVKTANQVACSSRESFVSSSGDSGWVSSEHSNGTEGAAFCVEML